MEAGREIAAGPSPIPSLLGAFSFTICIWEKAFPASWMGADESGGPTRGF